MDDTGFNSTLSINTDDELFFFFFFFFFFYHYFVAWFFVIVHQLTILSSQYLDHLVNPNTLNAQLYFFIPAFHSLCFTPQVLLVQHLDRTGDSPTRAAELMNHRLLEVQQGLGLRV